MNVGGATGGIPEIVECLFKAESRKSREAGFCAGAVVGFSAVVVAESPTVADGTSEGAPGADQSAKPLVGMRSERGEWGWRGDNERRKSGGGDASDAAIGNCVIKVMEAGWR